MRPGLTAGALGPSIVSLNTNKSSSSSSRRRAVALSVHLRRGGGRAGRASKQSDARGGGTHSVTYRYITYRPILCQDLSRPNSRPPSLTPYLPSLPPYLPFPSLPPPPLPHCHVWSRPQAPAPTSALARTPFCIINQAPPRPGRTLFPPFCHPLLSSPPLQSSTSLPSS
jgi:hypothetical protein